MKNVNNSTATRVACAILFLSFTFVYLYLYEGDMLVIEQHLASDGATHYEYHIGAVLLTVFLFLVQVGAAFIARLKGIFYCLTYFPSLIILTFLTDTPSCLVEAPASNTWLWQLPLMLALWGVAVWMARRYQSVEGEVRHGGLLNQLTFINVLILSLLLLIPCLMGNADRVFHQCIHQEFLITHAKYGEALKEGRAAQKQDKRQAMLNAYCLVRQGTLADSLFTLTIPQGMRTLSPGAENGHFYLLPDTTIWKRTKRFRDVLLANRLLARQLPQFATRLNNWYTRRTNLPTHFHEAVALCRLTHPKLVKEFPIDSLDSMLVDFQRLHDEQKTDSIRLKYHNTYWAYYYNIH